MQELCIKSSQYYVEANRRTMVHALRWKTQNTIDLKIISKKQFQSQSKNHHARELVTVLTFDNSRI